MTIEDFVRDMWRRGVPWAKGIECTDCPVKGSCQNGGHRLCDHIVSALQEAGVIPPVTRHQEGQ